MCSSFDKEAADCVQIVCVETEKLAATQLDVDSLPNLAALQLLSLSYIGYGKDDCVIKYRNSAVHMATRMKLLGDDQERSLAVYEDAPDDQKSSLSYAAWGTFNWTV